MVHIDEDVMKALETKDIRQSALIEAVKARIMSERIEKIMQSYLLIVMERNCLENQIMNFQGITASEMIESMYFIQPVGERVQTSGVKALGVSVSNLDDDYMLIDGIYRINKGNLWWTNLQTMEKGRVIRSC